MMDKNLAPIFLILLLTSIFYSCGQSSGQSKKLGRSQAENELKIAFTDSNENNIIKFNPVIIKDSLSAIKVVEPILFGIYGEDNIKNQRPYEAYLIGKHWVLSGTVKSGFGGTFLIIINSMDGKVLKITHGK